jgi:hypothetical protein
MSLIIEYLSVSFPVKQNISAENINSYICKVILPEVNSINQEEPSFYNTIPNQAVFPGEIEGAYFGCEEAFGEFYQKEATIEDFAYYALEAGNLTIKAATENTQCQLTRYIAWKLFCEFSEEDFFRSNAIYQDNWGCWNSNSTVSREAIEYFEA